ncbi:hypothetical protein ACXET9_05890 [Brachybacterium sp. DNPG3]
MRPLAARTLAALAVPLLALGLAGCGEEDPADPTVTLESTSEEATTPEPTTDEPTTEEATSEEPTAEDPAATEIALIWPDDSWDMQEVGTDLCDGGDFSSISPSGYSMQEDMFTCGTTASSLLACLVDDDATVVCITNGTGKTGVTFSSPTAVDDDTTVYASEGVPLPLYVDLVDGTRCTALSHDHDQHWDDWFSWYSCDDGSELLTELEIFGTFDERSDLWTVQRSTDKGEPVEDHVAVASFAGV